MFHYDVALSFAGEQRSHVLEVAECLKKAGVNVFYDGTWPARTMQMTRSARIASTFCARFPDTA
jgi:hypothetical protein